MRHLLAVAAGALVGLCALAVHRSWPWGLLLAVVTSLAVTWWLRQGDAGRVAASFALGWLVMFGIATAGRPEGDYAVAADASGTVMAGVALVMVVLGVTALARPRPTPRT